MLQRTLDAYRMQLLYFAFCILRRLQALALLRCLILLFFSGVNMNIFIFRMKIHLVKGNLVLFL